MNGQSACTFLSFHQISFLSSRKLLCWQSPLMRNIGLSSTAQIYNSNANLSPGGANCSAMSQSPRNGRKEGLAMWSSSKIQRRALWVHIYRFLEQRVLTFRLVQPVTLALFPSQASLECVSKSLLRFPILFQRRGCQFEILSLLIFFPN